MNPLMRAFVRTNAIVFRLTHGRLGSQLGKQSVLLLHTTGRKSGKTYTTPLSFYHDGDRYLIVASNWGQEAPPNWYRNLTHTPRAAIETRGGRISVEAHAAEGEEYQRLWQLVTRQNPQYLHYQQAVVRQIPIVILTPV
jgi:deazaflavin-dependent oxidoreductase (nitroreductase family)